VTAQYRVGRRAFLRGVATVSVAGVALGREIVSAANPAEAATPADGVVKLGRSYLKLHPDESNRGFLLAQLPGIDARRPVRAQLPSLASAFADDFAAARVVTVQGWQLSRTEARAAAAVALGA
jgi:hypothetical protein